MMNPTHRHETRRRPPGAESAWLALLLIVPGCGPPAGGAPGATLRILTTWPRAEREALASEFASWLAAREPASRPETSRLVWLEAGSHPGHGVTSPGAARADVLLGGALVDYVRLERAGRLDPLDEASPHHVLKVNLHSGAFTRPASGTGSSVALDDPRVDSWMLSWCTARLGAGPWQEGYAGLIRLAGRCSVPVGWRAGAARATCQRGEASLALCLVPTAMAEEAADELGPATPLAEGAAIVAGSPSALRGRWFLRFLAERRGASPLREADAPDPAVSELVADLLGAALVDAQDELLAAWAALGGVDAAPSAALTWMTEPPPWPPASVEKLLTRSGDRGLLLVHDLAGQLAPDPELRFWLIQSWLRPRRPVDQSLLRELARASGGRLAREPRFRSWLRGEWTAWARQRYRRVARLAVAAVPAEADAGLGRARSASRGM